MAQVQRVSSPAFAGLSQIFLASNLARAVRVAEDRGHPVYKLHDQAVKKPAIWHYLAECHSQLRVAFPSYLLGGALQPECLTHQMLDVPMLLSGMSLLLTVPIMFVAHCSLLGLQRLPQEESKLDGRTVEIAVEHVKAVELVPTCARKRRTKMDWRCPLYN